MPTYFFGMEVLAGTCRAPRTGRAAERASHTLFRVLEAKQDSFVQPGGGSADAPARAPRRSRTTSRKPASDGGEDSDGDDPALAELVSTLIERIAAMSRPAIPVSNDLWDVAHVAAYFKRSESVVRERIVCTPSFPVAIKIPTGTGRSHALWAAQEVIDWALKQRVRETA
jgi:hypothetical protein